MLVKKFTIFQHEINKATKNFGNKPIDEQTFDAFTNSIFSNDILDLSNRVY